MLLSTGTTDWLRFHLTVGFKRVSYCWPHEITTQLQELRNIGLSGLHIQAKFDQPNATISLLKHLLTQLKQFLTLTLWSLLMSPSLYSLLPSIMPDKGLENHSLKSLCDWKTCGIKKCIKDQSSIRLFCKGVPVRSSLQWLLKFSRYCHLWDLKFLMFWAYNRIKTYS